MIAESTRLADWLLEVNVLNVKEVERQLAAIGARAIHPQIKRWLSTVARNYILNLTGPEADPEFQEIGKRKPRRGNYTEVPTDLPAWAARDIEQKRAIHFFQTAQPRQRQLWRTIEDIVDWFNSLPAADTTLARIDRVGFDAARTQAAEWHLGLTACIRCGGQQSAHVNDYCPVAKDRTINAANHCTRCGEEFDTAEKAQDHLEGPMCDTRSRFTPKYWVLMRDRPPVVQEFPKGWRWVHLTTSAHFKREGTLMRACQFTHYDRYTRGDTIVYSLRDPDNVPHVSIEINARDRSTNEVKGLNNAKPNPRYQPYIRQFLRDQKIKLRGDKDMVDVVRAAREESLVRA